MKEYKIKDLLTIKNGKDHKQLDEGSYPVYGSGGIMRYAKDFLYDKPSILLPRKGTLNNIQYCDTPFWCVDTIYYSVVNDELANPYYLYRYLRLLDLKHLDSGTALPSMTFDSYYQIKVKLPDIEIQNKIAKALFSIDKKITLNIRMNAELEAMAKQLYDYWFVQFDFPDENGKPYKSSGGKMVWNEKLKREIPEGWEVKTVSDCIKHVNTGLNPRQNFTLGNGSIKYLTVKNLRTDGTIDYSNCDVIDEEARLKVHRRSDIQIKDILFASIAPLGRCHIILNEPTDWDINESVFSIRPRTDYISPYYLYKYFPSRHYPT